ncbi:probable arginine--tRNA ligase, mitochondrial isoform X2 [Panonychus citri]|uniref:probable arginine--tRNA ligase, mitochondrial isoform X2 n=1 Tax=Panonychus citri TaxID=50023 RepID=UPI0023079C60|nr:probable arginine--tRNA ligase, mitochondrial isoform X2 [Panonychus citri]
MTTRALPIKQYLTDWFRSNHSLRFKFKTLQSVNGELLLRPTLQSNVNDKLDSDAVQVIYRLPQEVSFVEEATVEDSNEGPVVQLIIKRDDFINDTINKLRHNLDDFPKICGLNSNEPIRQIIEFSSPNIAKPFHCGHLRSTIIGNALANIKSYLGNDVIRLNYLGDWGTQFGLLSHGYDLFGNEDALKSNPIKHLYDVYVKANQVSETDDTFSEEAKSKFRSMELNCNEHETRKWTLFRKYSMDEYDKIYRNLGITFDDFHFESMYSQLAHHWIKQLETLGLTETYSDGGKSITLEDLKKKNPDDDEDENQSTFTRVMLMKNDGSSLYISRDIAAAIDRMEKYNFNEMYYVVGKEQTAHFQQLRSILLKMGHNWARNLFHVSFGRVIGMRTRKGEAVFLQDIIDEAKQKCIESTLKSNTTKSDPSQIDRLASILGLTAIYTYDLKIPRGSDYKFNWSSALNLKGQSGISLQYVHARIHSIEKLSNVDLDLNTQLNIEAIDGSFWNKLLIHLSRFDDVLDETSMRRDPSILVRYLTGLSKFTNGCITVSKVKGEPKEIAQTRLLVYHCSRKILQKGLNLIGLEALDKI